MVPHSFEFEAQSLAELLVAGPVWRPASTTRAWQPEPTPTQAGSALAPQKKKKTAFMTPLWLNSHALGTIYALYSFLETLSTPHLFGISMKRLPRKNNTLQNEKRSTHEISCKNDAKKVRGQSHHYIVHLSPKTGSCTVTALYYAISND